MSRMELAVNEPERAVRWAVRWRQCLGLKQEHAFSETGAALGLSARYIRGVFRDEMRLSRQRWRQISRRIWDDMDRQAAEFRALAQQIEAKAEMGRLADKQLTLSFGETNDHNPTGENRSVALAPLDLSVRRY